MNYSSINDDLMQRFPELESLFQEQFEFWKGSDIPPHCFCADALNRYVTELLREDINQQQIEKIFEFYEELASCDDENVRNLLQVSLLEYLWDEEFVYKNALTHMLPNTRIINNEIASYLRGYT